MLGFDLHTYLPARACAQCSILLSLSIFCSLAVVMPTSLNPAQDLALLSPGRALAHPCMRTWLWHSLCTAFFAAGVVCGGWGAGGVPFPP
eukprot:9174556-Ditylum_brightwellii.AAC.1